MASCTVNFAAEPKVYPKRLGTKSDQLPNAWLADKGFADGQTSQGAWTHGAPLPSTIQENRFTRPRPRPLAQRSIADSIPQLPRPSSAFTNREGTSSGHLFEQRVASKSDLQRMAEDAYRAAQRSFDRGAPLSARKSAYKSLVRLAESTDALYPPNVGSSSLSLAMGALREAPAFLGGIEDIDRDSLVRLVDSHQTPVLKGRSLFGISRSQAAQVYYQFAQEQFAKALGMHPIASQVLVLFAQTEPYAVRDEEAVVAASQRCYLRTAILCDQRNSVAMEVLGASLIASGRYEEATTVLQRSQSIAPTSRSMNLLAETYRRLGNVNAAREYRRQGDLLASQSVNKGLVLQVTPDEFAGYSGQQISGANVPAVTASFRASADSGIIENPNAQDTGAESSESFPSKMRSWTNTTLDFMSKPFRSFRD